MSDKALRKALDDAFHVCFEISDVMSNVIASTPDEDLYKSKDVALKKRADNYLKWYKQTFKKT